jgi:phosphate transport system protein
MTDHTLKQFDTELERIRTMLLRMGGLVESMLQDSIDSLSTGDMNLVDRVKTREHEVNNLEMEIDENVTAAVVKNQPTAIDLRTLLSVSKILTDLERSGDEADKIASAARRIHSDTQAFLPVIELRHMSNCVTSMLSQVMDAFARQDAVLAASVVRSDKEVDREWKSALRNLISFMIEDPRTISRAIDMMFIARSIERIGDHCKNIAEKIIYMVHGADVRHQGAKVAEAVAKGGEAGTIL